MSSETPMDIYEFHAEEEDNNKFTSDDEIPIKQIFDKTKKTKILQNLNTSSSENQISTITFQEKTVNEGLKTPKKSSLNEHHLQASNKKSPNSKSSPKNEVKNLQKSFEATDKQLLATTSTNNLGKTQSSAPPKNKRKRKAFTTAAEPSAKRFQSSNRICDSSSDENSSSSRGTSLDLIIPPPKNFLGSNNPFMLISPKKDGSKNVSSSSAAAAVAGGGNATIRKSVSFFGSNIFNTSSLDFSTKLAALKSAGMFPHLSSSNLAKAAGQQRTVRTIKRRLSAKDIMIGPNQEVRRRRTRRLSSNVEVSLYIYIWVIHKFKNQIRH